jgi:hypothetical protein
MSKPIPMSVSLPPDIISGLDAQAKAAGKTRSALLADRLATLATLETLATEAEHTPDNLGQDLGHFYDLLTLGLARARRKITRPEASAILDVQNGVVIDPIAIWLSGGLAHQVSDGIALDGLDNKWGFDGPALVAKLESLTEIEVLGLLDWAARFWAGDVQADDAVEKAVAGFLEG